MPPQVGVGGCTPTPRNVRLATTSRLAASVLAEVTSSTGTILGSTWVRTTRGSGTPSSRAASTYWVWTVSSTEARTTRK